MKHLLIITLVAAATILSGCQNLHIANSDAVQNINSQLLQRQEIVSIIAVTTLTDIEQMHNTSPEAQMSSEILASELSQAGYNVIEVKLSDHMTINKNGEFSLSRNIRDLPALVNVSHLLVGTYMEKGSKTWINTRLIDLNTKMIVASDTYTLK
jgi:TolB-like protein